MNKSRKKITRIIALAMSLVMMVAYIGLMTRYLLNETVDIGTETELNIGTPSVEPISTDLVEESSEIETETTEPQPQEIWYDEVIWMHPATIAEVRLEPNNEAEIIGNIEIGVTTAIVGEYENWLIIEYDGMYAYVPADHMTTELILNLTDKEYDIFARLIMCEAGGEDLIGKVLVANVVINRTMHPTKFPNDVVSVIYANNGRVWQFSPVGSGKIDRVTASKQCYEALDMALRGYNVSQGALYFESCKDEDNWHSRNLEFLFKHGCHRFYK